MSTESTRELILKQLVDNYASMRQANGYWFNMSKERVSRKWQMVEQMDSAELPFIIVLPDVDTPDRPVMFERDRIGMSVAVLGFITHEDPKQLETQVERILRDIQKMTYANLDLVRENVELACDVKISSLRSDGGVVGYEDWAVCELLLEIIYDVNHTNP